jgi:hypothetical protein
MKSQLKQKASLAVEPIMKLLVSLQLIIFSIAIAIAQDDPVGTDRNVDVRIETNGGDVWYGQWWIWAILLAVFIIIIVAITNRGRDRRA